MNEPTPGKQSQQSEESARDEQASPQNRTPQKYFTVAEANQMLPLIKRIVSDLRQRTQALKQQKAELSDLRQKQESGLESLSADALGKVIGRASELIDDDEELLVECRQELDSLGLELMSAIDGVVDFPAKLGDRDIRLCWKLGEPAVQFWHEVESDLANCKPITDLPEDAVERPSE